MLINNRLFVQINFLLSVACHVVKSGWFEKTKKKYNKNELYGITEEKCWFIWLQVYPLHQMKNLGDLGFRRRTEKPKQKRQKYREREREEKLGMIIGWW